MTPSKGCRIGSFFDVEYLFLVAEKGEGYA